MFGRQGCKEDRDWRVIIEFVGDDATLKLVEQLAYKEALIYYEEAKKILQNSKDIVEFEVGMEKYCCVKQNIISIDLEQY